MKCVLGLALCFIAGQLSMADEVTLSGYTLPTEEELDLEFVEEVKAKVATMVPEGALVAGRDGVTIPLLLEAPFPELPQAPKAPRKSYYYPRKDRDH